MWIRLNIVRRSEGFSLIANTFVAESVAKEILMAKPTASDMRTSLARRPSYS